MESSHELMLDASQEAVIQACQQRAGASGRGSALSVLGAAGTGKTTLMRRCVASVLAKDPQARIAVLSPDRRAATAVRNALVAELSVLGENVQARSIVAFAFAIVSTYAQACGRAEPELLSGADQDALIRELIEVATSYYASSGKLGGVAPEVAELEAFRREYRELVTRTAELGLSAEQLRELGKQHDKLSWVIGAELIAEYEKALAIQAGSASKNPDRSDHARIVTQAAALLQHWDSADFVAQVAQPQWDWVFVDDIVNCTLAVRALLAVMQEQGARIVVFGDPDVAVQGYRGGIAQLPALMERPRQHGGLDAERFVLAHRYRGGGELKKIISQISSGIHVSSSAQQRQADFERASACTVSGNILHSEHDEVGFLATRIRHIHVTENVPYSDIAVITRSRAGHAGLRQGLQDFGIPVQALAATKPLRYQPVVADLLSIIELATADPESEDIASRLYEFLTGPLGDFTSAEMAHFIQVMHGWELAAGGTRIGVKLLASFFDPEPTAPAAQIPQFDRVRQALAKIQKVVKENPQAENVLWVAWKALDKAEEWRDRALAGGPGADDADRNLDAVIQLFRIAQRLSDRDPRNARIDDLLRVLKEQDVPEDSIARTSGLDDGVVLTSPSSAIGRTWSYVFVAQVNDNQWPDMRLRNPLTQVPELVSLVVGSELAGSEVAGTQHLGEVLDDELRMLLYAVTRATAGVEISCVSSANSIPSRFISWLFPGNSQESLKRYGSSLHLDTPTFIGQLRQARHLDDPHLVALAEQYLQKITAENMADIAEKIWVDELSYTSAEPRSQAVRISPSSVENILTCPMHGILDLSHGQKVGSAFAANLGTLVHQIAEETYEPNKEAMLERLAELWKTYDFGEGLASEQFYERAESMVVKLYEYLVEHPEKAHRELYGRVELSDIVVSGKIDRLEYVPGAENQVRVVDFKTGKYAPSKPEGENLPQLLIYQWLVEQGGVQVPDGELEPQISAGARLVHLGTDRKSYGETVQSELDAERRVLTQHMIETVAGFQRAQTLPARIQEGCRSCQYKAICPAQEGKRIFS